VNSGDKQPVAAAGPKTSFSDGTYEVNVDIAPGTYKTTVPATSRNCYWQRSKDVSGDFDSIIANANSKPGSPAVKILKSDVGPPRMFQYRDGRMVEVSLDEL
jgi:hypothetical protein